MRELQLLSILDFCDENQVSRSKTFDMIRRKILKAVKVGRMTRIRREDAEAWRAALPPAGSKRKPPPALSSWPAKGRKAPPQAKPPVRVKAVRPGSPGQPAKGARHAAE
jgi:excisionase family DNA binding protein